MSVDPETLEHAAALCDKGDFDAARELLQLALAVEPDDAGAWSLLARAQLGAGRFEEAILAADTAAALSGASADPHMIAALALLRLDRAGDAVRRARDAVRADPFDSRALGLLAQLLAGNPSTAREAPELAERMVRLAPEDPAVHLAAGRVAAASGERTKAKRAFVRALSLDPSGGGAHHELANLRLRRRANNPASLAEAAAGFARAAHAEPAAQHSRLRLELVLRVFLSKAAYLLLLDAYVVGRLTASSSSSTARLLPVLLLAVPVLYAARFLMALTPPLRRALTGVLATRGALRNAAIAEVLAVVAVVLAAFAPSGARTAAAAIAALAALTGRVILYRQVENASRAARGDKPRPVIGRGLLRLISVLLFLTAAALVLAAAKDKAGPGALLGAAAFGAGALAVGRACWKPRQRA